ncbi:YheC/YheD family protein [Alteribacter keqinensis]|uniref:ATP-grasp domain-containing protein n=1 Tax=Alteribacter keqinensis TaxID=2483800 RepID=A0A3M7TN26_9BACI|nr:YheC/YheD family protein [Alteribacter keqinensis]RNA66788.1 hypothetical protein EBO34_16405 [Alteribacter keqinensis]
MNCFWVKINETAREYPIIRVPNIIFTHLEHLSLIQHGLLKKNGTVKAKLTDDSQKGTQENPFIIDVSASLVNDLYLLKDIPYRLTTRGDTIKFGPVTGIMIRSQEELNLREEVYPHLGGILVSPSQFDWEKGIVTGEVYDSSKSRWVLKTVPLPEVIFNRSLMKKKKKVKLITKYQALGGVFYNSNRYNKAEVENAVLQRSELQKYVIKSRTVLDKKDVFSALSAHKKIVLKPVRSVQGNGIMFIKRKKRNEYLVYYYRKNKSDTEVYSVISRKKLAELLDTINFKRKPHLVQPWIRFLTYNKSPFDLRVHMHKDDRSWMCAGIECRVAQKGEKITNISKGGSVLSLSEALSSSSEVRRRALEEEVVDVCLKICTTLETNYPSECFADLGIDIAIDKRKKLHFIEVNFHPQFKGFQKISEEIYRKINCQPLIHATKLQGFKVDKKAS